MEKIYENDQGNQKEISFEDGSLENWINNKVIFLECSCDLYVCFAFTRKKALNYEHSTIKIKTMMLQQKIINWMIHEITTTNNYKK